MSDRTLNAAPTADTEAGNNLPVETDATVAGANPAESQDAEFPQFVCEYLPYYVQDHWFAEPKLHPSKRYFVSYRVIPIDANRARKVFYSCVLVDTAVSN